LWLCRRPLRALILQAKEDSILKPRGYAMNEKPPTRNLKSANDRSAPTLKLADLPHSAAAEAATLGSMILDPAVIPEVMGILSEDDFYLREHAVLWRMILAVYDSTGGKAADGLLVRERLSESHRLEEIGGLDYLRQVIESVPSSHSAEFYAGIVRDKAVRRAVRQAGQELVDAAEGTNEIAAIIETASTTVTRVGQRMARISTATDLMGLLAEAYASLEKDPEYAITCSGSVSQYVRGFQSGQMIVVCGRPAHGKTALGLHLAAEGLRYWPEKRVLFFSFEMLPKDMVLRILSSETGIPFVEMNRKSLSSREMVGKEGYARILQEIECLRRWNLYFAGGVPTPVAVAGLARRMHHEAPLSAIFVDYIQRMHCAKDYNTRDREMSVISNSLKNLALELRVPVVVLAQLNRGIENRTDHRPRLSDLRESGTIEQDADVVIAVNRPDRYPGHCEDDEGVMELHVLKNRNGADGLAKVWFDGPTMAVREQSSMEEVPLGN